MWWYTPVILAHRRVKKENSHEIEASLSYVVRLHLKGKKFCIKDYIVQGGLNAKKFSLGERWLSGQSP